jgi:hypothetical protein
LVAGLPAPNFGAKLVNDIDGSGAQRSVTKTKTDGFDAATISIKANLQVLAIYADRTDV